MQTIVNAARVVLILLNIVILVSLLYLIIIGIIKINS